MAVEILDLEAGDSWEAKVVGIENCKCVGFLELSEPREFEILDEKGRRIDSL